MKFSESWLRTLVDPPLSSEALSHALTMAGLEVEALETVAPAFSQVVVAEILSAGKHPDADRLRVCQVNAGEAAPRTIVCGAPNAAAGLRVPCALPGARLPGGLEIREAKVRGVASAGMLCSAKELGLAEVSEGLLVLESDADLGADIRTHLDLDDKLFTLKLTPNRGDCLSVAGVAREVAAVTGAPAQLPDTAPVAVTLGDAFPVRVDDAAACPRYCGRVIRGVNSTAATPAWMVRRLERSGLRSISAVVDVTNYVLLELGQPLHAFDLGKLSGGITVRRARDGERIALLNDTEATLGADMLVIADDRGPVAIAGIMGGSATAVDESSREVFLEAAFFSPQAIAGRARRLGFATDSSHRFERGVDFGRTRDAMERATRLIVDICGGAAGPVSDVMGELPSRAPIALRPARVNRVLGTALSNMETTGLLERVGLSVATGEDVLRVTPPTHRFDLAIEADLIEEIARLSGYDRLPAAAPHAALTLLPVTESARPLADILRHLVARDFQEVITYSFVDPAMETALGAGKTPVPLVNPIASQMAVMRTGLLPGLVETLRYNLNRRADRVRIFEVGRCFVAGNGGLSQPLRIGGLLFGPARAEQWGEAMRKADFFDAKAEIEALLQPQVAEFIPTTHPALHPGQGADIRVGGITVGFVGVLHPETARGLDLTEAPAVFELDLGPVLEHTLPLHGEVSRFPAVRRDLAVVVPESVSAGATLTALALARLPSVQEIALFDVYRGKGIEAGTKSLAYRILLQDTQKTLMDADIESATSQVLAVLTEKFGARLR